MRKPIRCWLGLHHWHLEQTEDQERYRRCSRCGVDEPEQLRAVRGAAVFGEVVGWEKPPDSWAKGDG
jgi:hypothetical protein